MKQVLIVVLALWAGVLGAQGGYQIAVEVDNYEPDTLLLGFYYGEKQYLKDTAVRKKDRFVFSGEEELDPGVYLLILQPDNSFVQINLNRGKQDLRIKFDAQDPTSSMQVKGDPDNTAFYEYLRFLEKQRPAADALRKALEEEGLSDADKAARQKELEELNRTVKDYQDEVIAKHPGTLTAQLIRAYQELEIPKFEGEDEKEVQIKRYRYFIEHYFDGLDYRDERLVRTPFLFPKVNDFVTKHTVQHPDSISQAVDRVLALLKPNEDAFKYFLVHFVNVYAKSNIIGMDAVYVHIVKKYYAQGEAPWVDAEQLNKMVKNAESLEPILIGKIAPDIQMEKRSGEKIALHQVESPYTVLMFWAPDCGHCKKSMPKVIEFYEKYKDQGVELFAVCTKVTDNVPDCWKMVDEKGMDIWINVVDPYLLSKFSTKYDIRSTPQIFVLDEKKEIIMKRLGAEQLDDVMSNLLERQNQIDEQFK